MTTDQIISATNTLSIAGTPYMKKKYYFETEDSEMCYQASHFDKGTEVFEAIPTSVDDMFWCKDIQEVAENGSCGIGCDAYTPRNGKSGMCKFRSNTLYTHGAKVIL